MKNLSLLFVALFAFLGTTLAQKEVVLDNNFAEFEKTSHDFGKITDEKDALVTFDFVNTSGRTIVLNPPKTECGCTTPSYPKEPIAAGETQQINVKYSTEDRVGKFIKDVRVYAQGFDDPITLRIQGEVVLAKEISTLPKKQKNSLFK